MTYTHAIARRPAVNTGDGATSADLGAPDMERMRGQHRGYVQILESLGLQVEVLAEDERFPDSCFVEDTAVVSASVAVIARLGLASRLGEEAAMEPLLAPHRPIERIVAPGTVDGGDILVMDEHVLIGLSARTNEEGARQLAAIFEAEGMRCVQVPAGSALHFKSSVNSLGGNRLLVTAEFAQCAQLDDFQRVVVPAGESYAGNSLWINDRVIVPSGFPATRRLIDGLGIETIETDVSEFRKMDGGLTCLSIRL